jgi:hypothetical protein
MKRTFYIVLVAALYAAMFVAILWIAGPPVPGPVETVIVIAISSVGISWLGTWRVEPYAPSTWPRYLLPSVFHGIILVIIAAVVAQTVVAG